MEKHNIKNKKIVKMTVLVRPHEFSNFLRFPRRTLIALPRAIFDDVNNNLIGYILEIVEERS